MLYFLYVETKAVSMSELEIWRLSSCYQAGVTSERKDYVSRRKLRKLDATEIWKKSQFEMFHGHNCISNEIKYHSLSHDFVSTDRQSPLLPSLCNTEVNEIPSFKGGTVIAVIETIY